MKGDFTIRRLVSGGLITHYLCTEIRTYMAVNFGDTFSELRPLEFYTKGNLT